MRQAAYHAMVKRALSFRGLFAVAASLSLAACAAPAFVSPVEVTRFSAPATSGMAQLGQGTISLRAAPGVEEEPVTFALYRQAVARELELLGYRVVREGGAQLATIALRQSRFQPGRDSPVRVGGNAGVGSYGSGVGVGLGIDLSGRPKERIERQLSVSIRAADAPGNLWEGRAAFTASTDSTYGTDEAAATRAASALFAGFPGNSGETITVE